MKAAGILLSSIRRDGGTQIRAALDEDTVRDYAEAYRAKTFMPPLIVFFDGRDHFLVDGFHRAEAALRTGLKRLPANIEKGTQRDAVLAACGANAEHGLRRSNADKRRAVETVLRDPEWCEWPDRRIARACGVSHSFVSEARSKMTQSVAAVDTAQSVKSAESHGTHMSHTDKDSGLEHQLGRGTAKPAQPEVTGSESGAGATDGQSASTPAPDEPDPDEPIPYRPRLEMDLLGLDVSEATLANWSRLEDALTAFDQCLRQAQAAVAEYIGDYTTETGAELQALRQAAHELAARARKSVRPKSVCLYCKDPGNAAARRENCNGCHGRGYLTDEQLGAVPRELVGTDKVIDQKRGGFVAPQSSAKNRKRNRIEMPDGSDFNDGRELVIERDDEEDGAQGW